MRTLACLFVVVLTGCAAGGTSTVSTGDTMTPTSPPTGTFSTALPSAEPGPASLVPSPSIEPSPTPAATSAVPAPKPTTAPATVGVTDSSSGSTVRLRIGQRLRVRLSEDSYAPPVSSSEQTLVRRSSAGGYPSDQPVDATFEALAAGSVDVTAATDYACFHTEPRCLRPSRLWTVHVIVT